MTWLLFCARILCGCSPIAMGAGDGCLEPLLKMEMPVIGDVRADLEAIANRVTRDDRRIVCRLEHRDGVVSKAWGPWTAQQRAEVCG